MFGNCCCNKKKVKKHNQGNQTDALIDVNDEKRSKELPILENIEVCAKKETITQKKINGESSVVVVVEQPKTSPSYCNDDDGNETVKRQSIVSDVKIEVSDEDDEVFRDGVGPPVKLAKNLGTPDQGRGSLPKWFSRDDHIGGGDGDDDDDDDEDEAGGTQEPPATPVGRDELALRRHRLFSDLINAAQNATQHRVSFDPLGPVIAGVSDESACCHQFSELDSLVSRLEIVTVRLEKICSTVHELPQTKSNNNNNNNNNNNTLVSKEETETATIMSVQGFADILQGPFAQYLSISQSIGGDVAEHSKIVKQAFQAQYQYLTIVGQSKQPTSQSEQMGLLQPTSLQISAIQDYREKHRTSPFFNHLSAISESIPALGWVTVSPAPAPYVKEMNDAGQFYTNRVLKEWKEKDKKHVDWVKSWIQTLSELQNFVKQHHTTGLVWAGKNAPPTAIPPPPPGCPPPPPLLDDFPATMDNGTDRSALFAQINQGENITKNLKKVTADMQTHKNPTLRQGPAPFKAPTPTAGQFKSIPSGTTLDKPPSFVRDGKKWLIEYQKGNHNLVVENAEMNNVVYLFKCVDSTVTVKGKINTITLDSCKKTSVVFDTLVSCIEFINCQSVQMQVFGKVPTISIDKTDGCQMYLSQDALDVEVVSSKSSEMNIMVPKPNGDYAEYPVPEQYKTTVVPGKGLNTVIVENKG